MRVRSVHRLRGLLFLGAATLIALTIALLPLGTLTGQARLCLAITCAVLFLWISGALPFHVTGLIGMAGLAITGVETLPALVQYGFGNSVIIFFLSLMIIAGCISQTSIIQRITLRFLLVTGNNCKRLLLIFLVAGSLLTSLMTKIITFTILLAIAKEILREEKIVALKSNFGKALMLAALWAPTIGCMGSIAAAPPNALSVTLIESIAGTTISFGSWALYGIPSILLSIVPAWGLLIVMFPLELQRLSYKKESLRARIAALPPLSKREYVIAAIFLAVVVIWLASDLLKSRLGVDIPPALPLLIACSLLLLPPLAKSPWKVIEKEVPWDTFILVATASAIGITLYRTEAVDFIARLLLPLTHALPLFPQTMLLLIITVVLKTLMANNSASTAFLTPMAVALASSLPEAFNTVLIPISLFSAVSFFMPTASPTNALSFSQGYYLMKDLIKSGIAMTVVSVIVVTTVRTAIVYLVY